MCPKISESVAIAKRTIIQNYGFFRQPNATDKSFSPPLTRLLVQVPKTHCPLIRFFPMGISSSSSSLLEKMLNTSLPCYDIYKSICFGNINPSKKKNSFVFVSKISIQSRHKGYSTCIVVLSSINGWFSLLLPYWFINYALDCRIRVHNK